MTIRATEVFNKKPVDIPVVAVTGGKGGTGKTSVAVNLAVALDAKRCRVMLVDTDVDSPAAATVLGAQPEPLEEVEVFVPKIIDSKCDMCGKCAEACRAHALIQILGKKPMFFEELCSGCEACLLACPSKAIDKGRKLIGYVSYASRDRMRFIGGELKPNESRSAQVVTATKASAFAEARKRSYDIMVVDTAPGTHCSVVQGLRGADLALAVTEPTPLGTYDLALILELTSILGIPCKVVVNKADLPGSNMDAIIAVAGRWGSEVIAEIPVDMSLFESYVTGKPILTSNSSSIAARRITELSEATLNVVKGK